MDKQLPGAADVMLDMYGAESFRRDAAARSPEHSRDFEQDLELPYVHTATLAGIVRQGISDRFVDAGSSESLRSDEEHSGPCQLR